MTRFPKTLFALLCAHAEPHVLGLRYVGYDGGAWLEVGDRERFRQTMHGLQESFTSGDRAHQELHWRLRRLVHS